MRVWEALEVGSTPLQTSAALEVWKFAMASPKALLVENQPSPPKLANVAVGGCRRVGKQPVRAARGVVEDGERATKATTAVCNLQLFGTESYRSTRS